MIILKDWETSSVGLRGFLREDLQGSKGRKGSFKFEGGFPRESIWGDFIDFFLSSCPWSPSKLKPDKVSHLLLGELTRLKISAIL
jgi:hypothetical protein